MSDSRPPAALTLVPTPIGNLEDITVRALRILKEVDVVACEDTRTSGGLFQRFGIETPRTAFHAHNEHARIDGLVQRMADGERVALVSDAGTPGISDPGFLLVRAAVEAGLTVEALPGPTAFVPALVASGIPCDRFVYEGFLPHKKGRQTRLDAIAEETRTVVFYESPHRLVKLLGELQERRGPDAPAAVARELTKLHEEVRRGSLAELIAHYEPQAKVRGEIAVVLGGAPALSRKERRRRERDADRPDADSTGVGMSGSGHTADGA